VLDDALDCLACPLCEARLSRHGGTLRCEVGHSFDIARQGYASLLPGDAHTGTADTAAMLEAREAFFAAGHFDLLVRAVAERASALLTSAGAGCVVDVGAGPGRYLAAVLDAAPGRAGVALDLSKHAARRAARAHPRVAAAVADTWGRLPVATGAAALILDVFAPRNAAEFRRVLAPDGALIVVTPTARHLREAVEALGLLVVDEGKGERLAGQLQADFAPESEQVLEMSLKLSHTDLRRLALMGPSSWHVDEAALAARIAALPEPFRTSASVRIATYRPR
jgi:23S rRNA (guanine745-N1)-methyltransferase